MRHMLVMAAWLSITGVLALTPSALAGISTALAEVSAHAAPGELVPVCLGLRESPDVSRTREAAETMHAGVLQELFRLAASGEARDIRHLWIADAVAARITPRSAWLLARRPDVAWVDIDIPTGMLEASPAPAPLATKAMSPASIAWNLEWIGAPAAWSSGYVGAGVLIAVLDTGIDYMHPDLVGRMYRNAADPWPPDGVDNDGNGYVDDYYGWDIVNRDPDPRDDHGHGTRCSGTIAGDGTSGIATGVAPGAKLLAVKVIGAGAAGTPSDVIEGIQYAIARGAKVINLGLGWFQAGGSTRGLFRAASEFAQAAGVTICAEAGADRGAAPPPPDLMRTPGDVPPPWIHPDVRSSGSVGGVITVGGTGYGSDVIATFSSNGPVRWNDIAPWFDWAPPYLLKPDLVAPGVNIPSAVLGEDYSGGAWSGTAMATAHVSGLVALMLSKDPDLLPSEIDEILEVASLPLGVPGKDNDYGAGRIRAPETMAAVEATRTDVPAGEMGAESSRSSREGAGPDLSLAPASPNPAGAQGTILRFRLRVACRVSLRVFGVSGAFVQEPASGEFSAGEHEVTWDGRDAAGRPVASGMYVVRLQASGATASRAMVVAR